ncbi:putative lipid II flippase FtsW [uncultured Ferrimonas sp.]|uniref:putative lipid II flippase FtsW n=1 Tax=uncultured Ferrimonas sp. TaxID=432640 RepID=UPI0026214172|nr:putative lipid II flippase FtsW [uncultured Ferrimonas sp.]
MLAAMKQRLTPRLPAWPEPQFGADEPLFDRFLLVLIFTLLFFGLMMVTSASMPEATRLTGNPLHFIYRQGFFVAVAVAIMAAISTIKIELWDRISFPIAVFALLLLIAVLVVGKTVNGAQRWIPLGIFNLQVAEVAKFCLFAFLAGYLVRRNQEVREHWLGFAKAGLVFAAFALLLLQQPDFGTVIVMLVTTGGMLFLAGARLIEFAVLIIAALVGVVGLVAGSPYRLARVQNFLDPWQDPFGNGYQLTQSLMAYGRGDWLGEGLGNSIQKLDYLPEAHTDFIAAVVGEELGFIGVATLLCLQLALALRALWIGHLALKQQQPFAGYWAYGIGIWFSFQTAVNIGASVGALPTKGLTLPLVSYGGSSLWVMSAAVAVLVRIDHERRVVQRQPLSRNTAPKEAT